jgi:ketosteroid isomerase-like protein
MEDLVERVKAFVRAIETDPRQSISFYAPDAVQEEFPNRLLPNGAVRRVTNLADAAEKGAKVVASQKFEIVSISQNGNLVVLEAIWLGTLAVPVGSLKAGDVMRARFAQFFEFRDGLIVRQRNYDCFDPF